MRSFVAALLMAGATVTAQSTGEYLACATAIMEGIDVSKFTDCSDMSSTECFCTNKEAISELTESAKDACNKAGIDMSDLDASLCGNSDEVSGTARHASKPMQPVENMNMLPDMDRMMQHNTRAYSPSMNTDSEMPAEHGQALPKVVYVTKTEPCACKTTPAPNSKHHVSQIPVHVPASSSMGAMLAASSPAMSNGVMVGASSSSVLFGAQMSAATPTPSGVSPNRFNAFQGAAPAVSAAHSGVAALGVAAVMGLMIAL